MFIRAGEDRYTDHRILEAEARLLATLDDVHAPTARPSAVTAIVEHTMQTPRHRANVRLAPDQVGAVRTIATSGNRLEVLVGPAGTGKTTTLLALARAWTATHGSGSVIGLAPSATAAAELADALGIACENTAKWLYESTGPGRTRRAERTAALQGERAAVDAHTHPARAGAIDTQLAALHRADADWSLNPCQLLIVDEASLAGTLALDTLIAQARAADAKVLLVGDHAQLSAVDAGGAFHLLTERGRPVVLSSLWRFSHRWEAEATRHLRTGRPAALDAYFEHDRVSAGPSEAMLEDGYTRWQDSEAHGHSAILLAADGRTVRALNARAHADRVADGLVAPDGLTTADGDLIACGDRILTRANARHLRTGGRGHVRNGEIWDVLATHPDGSLTVTRAHRDRRTAARDRVVRLPAEYVAHDVDLGYATTTHRAQGVTVDHAHVLAAAGMTRENLYVAMTRGRHLNRVYVALDAIDPTCDDLPDHHRAGDARDILERILATPGAELSATQTITRALDDVASRDRLEPIRETLLADAAARRWRRILHGCGLSERQVEAIWASADRAPLIAALRRGEAAGFPMRDLVNWLAEARVAVADGDLARTLTGRLANWLDRQTDDSGRIMTTPGWVEPIDPDDPAIGPLRDIDSALANRLAEAAVHGSVGLPDWLPPEPGIESDSHDSRPRAMFSLPDGATQGAREPWPGPIPPTSGPVR